jgi:hypothetical protein
MAKDKEYCKTQSRYQQAAGKKNALSESGNSKVPAGNHQVASRHMLVSRTC